ncbi:MAG: acetylornithine/succinylornithine family transaminase [Spirochaetaceae bacterium]|jgi:acetylornithine/N-succinyldiaminopimelate aminotransferase|nr:acetylornithine/succinylornithine family transaminase [Spirochaetaceae bacterium]
MKLKDIGKTVAEIKNLTNKYLIETYERYDFVCERAEGNYLYDEKGSAYLDFYGGIAVNSAGSRNPAVIAAAKEQMDDVIHTFNYPYLVPQALLAEKICTTLGFEKIFYQNSGTEANEAMIKMARKYGIENFGPNRYHIISAKDSFHGRTMGALAATGQPHTVCQIGFGPMLPGFSYAEFNNLDDFRAKVTPDTIAIMLEPIQGEGGVHPATHEFLTGIRTLCDDNGLLLLLDEIQTGWCRTGKVMAYEHYGVRPDILSMAKAMGGGFPISAICTSEKIGKAFNKGSHGSTYGGNSVCCAAALAQINELLDNDLAGKAAETGAYFMEKLKSLPHVKTVRGKGLLVGAEFDSPISLAVKHAALDRKLLVTAIGDRLIRMVPPLTVTKADCDAAYAILEASVKEAEKH